MMELQVAVALTGILGAGLSSYIGVRVALAEIRKDLEAQKERIGQNEKRLDRLEASYFDRNRE